MSWEIAGNTVLFFTLIFALTLIYNLLQIRLANPIELLHAGSQGEREPKTKWFLTMAGIIFLGIGYTNTVPIPSNVLSPAFSRISLIP